MWSRVRIPLGECMFVFLFVHLDNTDEFVEGLSLIRNP
jgi:hypothetical protein